MLVVHPSWLWKPLAKFSTWIQLILAKSSKPHSAPKTPKTGSNIWASRPSITSFEAATASRSRTLKTRPTTSPRKDRSVFLFIGPTVYRSIYLSFCSSVRLSNVRLSIVLSVCLCVTDCPNGCLVICLSVFLFVCLSICPYMFLSDCLLTGVVLFICDSVCLSFCSSYFCHFSFGKWLIYRPIEKH